MPTLAKAQDLYLEHAELINDVLTYVARWKRLTDGEADELAAHVKAWLVEDDYGLLRKYTGKNGAFFRTYLITAIQWKLIDWRRSNWGKWRPSAAAKRDGIEAELLERYMHRDGFAFEETCEHLRRNHGVQMSSTQNYGHVSACKRRFTRLPVPGRAGRRRLTRLPVPGRVGRRRLTRLPVPGRAGRRRLTRLPVPGRVGRRRFTRLPVPAGPEGVISLVCRFQVGSEGVVSPVCRFQAGPEGVISPVCRSRVGPEGVV